MTFLQHCGRRLTAKSAMTRAVMLSLACADNQRLSVDRLCALLWDNPPQSAISNLRNYVSHLRKLLPEGFTIRTHRAAVGGGDGGYELQGSRRHLDMWVFRDLLRQAGTLHGNQPARSLDLYERSLKQWKSDIGFGLPVSTGIRTLCTGLNLERATAVECYASLAINMGHGNTALPELASHVARHPHRGDARRLLDIVDRGTASSSQKQREHDMNRPPDEELVQRPLRYG